MPLLSGDAATQLAFSVFQNRGVFALLLGSGLSRSAGILTGWEITLDLIRRVALAKGITEQADWAAWYHQEFKEDPNYSGLLEEISTSPDERRAILNSYIEPTADDRANARKLPTPAHFAVADLVAAGFIRVIITTNFDRLLENALRDRGVEPTVVTSTDALLGAEPLTHSKCFILKLHGDYKDARIRNTDQELSAYSPEYDALLDRILDEHGLVVCGWSGEWDHALRAAILRSPNRRFQTFWAARGAVGTGAQEIVDLRKARVITVTDANGFFTRLQSQVETLQSTERQDPLSVELAVNSAKRYLVRPEFRIQLDDLITDQIKRLLAVEHSTPIGFTPTGTIDAAAFRVAATRHEASAEALAKISGVLGRWGDGGELPQIIDVLAAQYKQAESVHEHYVAVGGLRSYPSVLVFTAYALGLVRSSRWETLHALLVADLIGRSDEPRRIVDCLFSMSWKGHTDDIWKRMAGFENRRTAFSDMQCELFKAWSEGFVGATSDFELLWERFEILASLAHLERHSETDLEIALGEGQQFPWVFMPVGRVVWDASRRRQLVGELKSAAVQSALIAAGFGRGSPRMFDLFFRNLDVGSSLRG